MSYQTSPDCGELLALAREGNDRALGYLMERYQGYLMFLARRQIGHRLQGKADAGDLVQETFLQASHYFSKFRGCTEAEFAHWLRQILVSRIVQLVQRYVKAQCRDVRLECDLENELEQSSRLLNKALVAPESSPSHHAAGREQAVLLAGALERLPDVYREVLVLRHLDELSFPEISKRMGKSQDSVEKLWTRALAQLRTFLKEDS